MANVKSIFEATGLNKIWLNQATTRSRNVILKDQHMQSWHDDISTSDKCLNYRLFIECHCYEQYLDILSGYSCIQEFIYFRLFNTHLPIEKGRWLGIPRNERVCRLCNSNQLGDEFHYLFSCQFFFKILEENILVMLIVLYKLKRVRYLFI